MLRCKTCSRKLAVVLFSLLRRARWSIEESAFSDADGVYRLIYGAQCGYEIRFEGRDQCER